MADDRRPARSDDLRQAPATARPWRAWSRITAATVRWIHIYLSMAAFGTMLLFSITGLTLNHPEWFGAGVSRSEDLDGRLDPALLGSGADDPRGERVDKLMVAETLRARHTLRGAVSDFRSDDLETTVSWKGPGYAAYAVVDRATGRYTLSVTRHGFVDILNDLHKGRDTGAAWSFVIDLSAVLLVIAAVTGFLLVFWIRRRRLSGILVALAGTLAILAAGFWLVP